MWWRKGKGRVECRVWWTCLFPLASKQMASFGFSLTGALVIANRALQRSKNPCCNGTVWHCSANMTSQRSGQQDLMASLSHWPKSALLSLRPVTLTCFVTLGTSVGLRLKSPWFSWASRLSRFHLSIKAYVGLFSLVQSQVAPDEVLIGY